MKSTKYNQKGFSLIEGLLILIAVTLIAFVGYYVWHAQRSANDTLDTAINSSQKSPNKVSSDQAQKYLVIKEWHARIPLSEVDKGAYYIYYPQDSQSLNDSISVYDKGIDETKNAKGVACKDSTYPLFVIDRVKNADVAKTSDPNSNYFIVETNEQMYRSFPFTNEYKFIGRSIHQSAPQCSNIGTDVDYKADDIVGSKYTAVDKALDTSYKQMTGE